MVLVEVVFVVAVALLLVVLDRAERELAVAVALAPILPDHLSCGSDRKVCNYGL